MIGPESIRAFSTPTPKGIIGTVEWICTTGGQNALSYHYSKSLLWKRGEFYPLYVLIMPTDDFGGFPDLDITMSISPVNSSCTLRRLPRYGDPGWQLPQPIATIPVIHDERLSSCRFKILRGSDYIADHFCDITEMRRITAGGEPTKDADITRERYERQ